MPAEASSFQNCAQLAGRKPDLDSVGLITCKGFSRGHSFKTFIDVPTDGFKNVGTLLQILHVRLVVLMFWINFVSHQQGAWRTE